jgi:hypothetical protein
MLKLYGAKINTTAACKSISKSMLDFFSKVSQVCYLLIKLTPRSYVADLMFPPEIIEKKDENN